MPAEHSIPEDKSRRTLIIVFAIVAAVLIGGFFYLLLRKTVAPTAPATLQGAIRPGSPDWDKYNKLIVLDEQEADEAKRALGDTVMSLHATVRNLTGRTITGLEIKGAVVDHDGRSVKERTIAVIPGRQAELEPNKTMKVAVMLEGFSDGDDRANIKLEVTGFTLR
ncbi:MAG TPA: FxLYD domain-containing protein [Pyrinomonadaceae bacterium]|nr:FxLYD domain-containing protein [Pyrinomonadaceae bacterium]